MQMAKVWHKQAHGWHTTLAPGRHDRFKLFKATEADVVEYHRAGQRPHLGCTTETYSTEAA